MRANEAFSGKSDAVQEQTDGTHPRWFTRGVDFLFQLPRGWVLGVRAFVPHMQASFVVFHINTRAFSWLIRRASRLEILDCKSWD